MEIKELRNKNEAELKEKIKDLKKQMEDNMETIFKGKDKNFRKIRVIRKDLARVMTVLNEKTKLSLPSLLRSEVKETKEEK